MRVDRKLWPLVVSLIFSLTVGVVGNGYRAQASSQIIIGTTEALTNLDLADAGDVFSWEVLSHLYTGLTRQLPGTLHYDLALAATHTVSTDGLTHRFTIRPDAAFDDGTPISVRTFVDSINRVLRLQGHGGTLIAPYIKSVGVDTSGALAITLTAPIPYLDQLLALPPFFPVHPGDFKPDEFNRTPSHLIGNGVFELGSMDAPNMLTLVADPAYKGTPAVTPTIILKHFDVPEDLRRALVAHQVDIAWRGLPPDDAQIATQSKDIHAITAPGLQTFYLLIGQNQKPFDDPGLRQGMLYLMDREQVAATALHGTGTPLYTLVPPQLAGPSTPTYPKFDLTQGKSVLDKAGYSQYRTADSELESTRIIYGEAYFRAVDQLSSTLTLSRAIRTTIQDIAPQTVFDQIERGTFRLVVVGWTPLVPHPDAYLQPLLGSTGQLAVGAHYANPQIDKLLDQAARLSDPTAQANLYNQVQVLALKDVIAIPLWQANQSLVAWTSVSGVLIEPNYLLHYDRLQTN